MDSRVVIDETSPLSGMGRAVEDPEQRLRLKKRARRMGVLAVVACPCHLPLVATILAFVGFGGSAAALRDNLVVVTYVT